MWGVYKLHWRTRVADHGESPHTRIYTPSDHQPVPRFEHVQWTRHQRERIGTHEHRQIRVVELDLWLPADHSHQAIIGVL